MYKALFISDIHIASPEDPKAQLFEKFLVQVQDDPEVTHLFLLGDIFDLWIADHEFFIQSYKEILNQLASISQSYRNVFYFEGNHDLYLKPYFEKKLGIQVLSDAQTFNLGDLVVRAEHGDLIDPDDRGYRFLRWFLRTPVLKFLAFHLPAKSVVKIGENASHKSRAYTSEIKTITNEKAIEKVRDHAEKCAANEDFDFIISGHVHAKDEYKFESNGKPRVSWNLGTWLTEPGYLQIDQTGCQWIPL